MAIKKWTSLLLTGLLALNVCVMPTATYAAEMTTDQKATLLNSMNLITGDGTSFQLTQKLKRGEAAAFMVKLLGMNATLMTNAATYKNTGFKDVGANEWYAPYVGYCVKSGIISGYPDKTFKPNDVLSEKAFYSMLLKALGYTASDFDWNTVYRKALEAGVSQNVLNAFSTEDNTNFLRGNVVDTMYLALKAKYKGSDRLLIENLIDNKVITKEFAAKNGFMKIDLLPMQVVGNRVIDAKTIEVTLNEAPQNITVSNVKIYKAGSPGSPLTVLDVSTVGNKLTFKTLDPLPSQQYTIEVTNAPDADGNVVGVLRSDYVTPAIEEVKSTLFRISKIQAVTLKSFEVTFTQPVTEKAELELLYSIGQGGKAWVEGGYKTITVKRSTDRNNVVLVSLLTQTMKENDKYDLTIRGDLISGNKMNLNNGEGDTMSFYGKNGVSTAASTAIADSYSQDGRFIVIEYSQKVDKTNAMNRSNYVIKEKDTGRLLTASSVYMTSVSDKIDRQVVLKVESMVSGKAYELTVKNLYTEFQADKIPDLSSYFVMGAVPNQELSITAIQAMDKYSVYVYFNRELSASTLGSGLTLDSGLIVTKRVLDASEPRLLKLYLSTNTPMTSGTVYKLSAYPGLNDFAERTFSKVVQLPFAGSSSAKAELAFTSANFTTVDTITAKFNQGIDPSNAVGDHFEVYHNDGKVERLIIPEVVSVNEDGTVVLKLPVIMAGGKYTVKAKNIMDMTGNLNATVAVFPITNEVK